MNRARGEAALVAGVTAAFENAGLKNDETRGEEGPRGGPFPGSASSAPVLA